MQRDRARGAPAVEMACQSKPNSLSAKLMVCLWNTDEDLKISDLLILSLQDRYEHLSRLQCSDGAICSDWMKRPLRNPLGIYARMATVYGFASREIHLQALRQFQQIRGQRWAFDWAREIGGGR
jgi:hypothetical protein